MPRKFFVRYKIYFPIQEWSAFNNVDSNCRLLSVDEQTVYKVPTIEKLRALFDNYEVDASNSENVTPNERQENADFINAVLDTKVMQTTMEFLNKKGLKTHNNIISF